MWPCAGAPGKVNSKNTNISFSNRFQTFDTIIIRFWKSLGFFHKKTGFLIMLCISTFSRFLFFIWSFNPGTTFSFHWTISVYLFLSVCPCVASSSGVDPDPYVFGPPGSWSFIILYGSGSFHQQSRKLIDFYYTLKKKYFYLGFCQPLRSEEKIRIRIWIRKSVVRLHGSGALVAKQCIFLPVSLFSDFWGKGKALKI